MSFKITERPKIEKLLKGFTRASDKQMPEDMQQAMRYLGRRFVGFAQDEAPKKTGKFAKGIGFRTFNQGNSYGFIAGPPKPLGIWIVKGTKPHPITPKGPGYPLRFFWEKVGKVVYFYHVNHPGTKANPFMGRAYERWKPEGTKALKQISADFVTHWRTNVR